jgi:hypothetical protein
LCGPNFQGSKHDCSIYSNSIPIIREKTWL